jgi:aryl-alcohol dehydrogenase-like predicted oxidoreductase
LLDAMKQLSLGKTGIRVSQLGLGGLFTSSLGPGFEESRQTVRRAVELGINYIDTAPAYANSEEVLGQILKDVRDPLVVSTKLGGRPQPFQPRNRGQLRRSFAESQRLLGRRHIDVLFIHEPDRPLQYNWWTNPAAVEGPVLEVLEELKQRGDVRATGLGGTTVNPMAHLVRSGKFDVLLTAFNYSALFREAERELLPVASERKLGIVLGSVLQQGALGRRFDAVLDAPPPWLAPSRREQFRAFYCLLDELGMPIAELCLRFAISNTHASSVLIGPKTVRHVEEAVAAVEEGPLGVDVLKRLDVIAGLVPFRPFEEPMVLPFSRPNAYFGPGNANTGAGAPVGKT